MSALSPIAHGRVMPHIPKQIQKYNRKTQGGRERPVQANHTVHPGKFCWMRIHYQYRCCFAEPDVRCSNMYRQSIWGASEGKETDANATRMMPNTWNVGEASSIDSSSQL